MVDIGRLNKRITFLQLKDEDENGPFVDEYGRDYQKLVPYKTVWASVEPTKSDEVLEVERSKKTLYYTIFVRYNNNINDDMVINYKGKKLEILGAPINYKEESTLLKIFCKHKVGDKIE